MQYQSWKLHYDISKLYLRLPLEFQCYSGVTEYQMMKEHLPLVTALWCFRIHSQAIKPDGPIIMPQFGTSVLDSSSQLLVIEMSLHLLCFKSALWSHLPFLWLPSGPVIDLCVPINIIRAQKYGWLPIAPDMLLICWQFYKILWRSMATEIYSFTFPYRNLSWLEIALDHQASCSKWYSFPQPNVAITSTGGPLQSSLNMFDWV